MDPQAPIQTNSTPPVPTPPQTLSDDKKGSNKLLMITIGVILLGFGMLGGYLIANQANKAEEKMAPLPTFVAATETPSPSPSPTPNPNTKIIKAGMGTSLYSIEVPKDWTDSRENTQAGVIDKLTLAKNGYTLTIYQAAMGGGGCLYPGDQPAEMSQNFTDFAEVKGKVDDMRRSWNQTNAQTITYTICKKGTDGSYGTFSSFGAISAVSPNPADKKILTEIDSMLASLMKQ